MKQNITILGSTGSIGVSTLDVIERNAERYQVFALTANKNIDKLIEQCIKFKPKFAVVAQEELFSELQKKLRAVDYPGEILAGNDALVAVAKHADVDSVMAAIVGSAGLLPTLAAAQAGKRVLLANKEALVMAGTLFMQTIRENKATLLPIDSEHNALFQCFPRDENENSGVRKLILTASGGAFRDLPLEQLANVTPAQACTHPNWSMGQKITVDSATMMNKALEVIEAHYLFNMPAEKIEVILHRQSIVHSIVEYMDGSMLAQLGNSDMRIPIAYGLGYPDRITSGVPFLDLVGKDLTFAELNRERFPSLNLAYEALRAGGTAATIINAANEVAVAAFLTGKIKFTDIYRIVQEVLDCTEIYYENSLEAILATDKLARMHALKRIK